MQTLRYLFVCYSDNTGTVPPFRSTTTSTSTVSCSPRWIVYHNLGSTRGYQNSATTQQQCLDTCVANSSCISVDWYYWTDNTPSCWMHFTRDQHYPLNNNTQFEIVKRCNPMTGRLRDASKFLLQNYFVWSFTIDFTSARFAFFVFLFLFLNEHRLRQTKF